MTGNQTTKVLHPRPGRGFYSACHIQERKITTMGKFFSRLAAGVGVVALATAGLLGAASPASAEEPVTPSLANIDPSAPTSLTIHKYDGNEGEAGDGTVISDTSGFGNALEGVQFSITPVTAKDGETIDLTTYRGWELINGVQVADVTAADSDFTLGTATTATTLADGTVTTGLPKGLYLVTETDPGNNNITRPVVPFLVSLPYPNSADWIYDVHVYPKNVVDDTDITKTVSDPTKVVLPDGTLVTDKALVDWTITVPVPAASEYTTFIVNDPLDARLTYDSIKVSIGGTELLEGTDYDVTGNIVVTFRDPGLGKLVAGTSVVLVLTTEVDGSGIIPNTVSAVVNNFNTTIDPTTTPSTNWAPLKVIKQDDDNEKLLKDAEFEIYLSDKTTQVGTAAYTTDSNGEINVTLWVGNDDDITETYWLKETKAPAGYTTPTGDAAWTQVDLVAGATEVVTKTIDNEKRTGPGLPLTGGQGTMLFLIAGVAIIGAAGGTLIFRKARA